MKIFTTSFFFFLISINCTFAQNETTKKMSPLPYHQIPETPTEFTPENVAARMIDGLGYRYYWATESLREEDLTYQASEDSRTTAEVLEHLYSLSKTIVNGSKNAPNNRPAESEELTWEQKRAKTLENFKMASDILKESKANLEEMNIIFQRGENKSEFPYWNMLNGPIADAIWHAGQIVAFRRASGNPVNPKMNVFSGKTKE
ncbi:MAG: hypothetical protein ACI9XO_003298 [Paraglaciecola sp.]|jgi:hypothetical protein